MSLEKVKRVKSVDTRQSIHFLVSTEFQIFTYPRLSSLEEKSLRVSTLEKSHNAYLPLISLSFPSLRPKSIVNFQSSVKTPFGPCLTLLFRTICRGKRKEEKIVAPPTTLKLFPRMRQTLGQERKIFPLKPSCNRAAQSPFSPLRDFHARFWRLG